MNSKKRSTLLIPLDIIKKVLIEKIFPEFQLFVYLKMECDGKIKIDPELKEIIKNKLDLKTSKTVTNRLKKLQKYNWVGFNKKSKYYFIRSFNFLRTKETKHLKTNIEFSIENINQMKAFIIGAMICHLIRGIERRMRKVDFEKGRSRQTFRRIPSYVPLANNYIAKALNISISTANKYKTIAAAKKHILIRKKNTHLEISKQAKQNIQKNNKEIAYKLRIHFNKLYIQEADEILPLMKFKTKKQRKNHSTKSYKTNQKMVN